MKLIKKIKAQLSIEFIVLIAFMFLVFLGFAAITIPKIIDAKGIERQKIAEDIATLVNNEISIARAASDGYFRTFTLPQSINGNAYGIEIIDNRELVVNYLDKEHVVFLPQNIIGNVGIGVIEIKKVDGVVYLQIKI